jgi:hypothetical protein
MKDFKKQKVWQKSHQLALDIYKSNGKLSTGRVIWINQPTALFLCLHSG